MLELCFINVGDGDAILIEDREDGRVFRMLVDAGRRDVGRSPGSLRRTAADYLREKGIARIDVLIVTHLHTDHFGGLEQLLAEVRVDRVYAGFFPSRPDARAASEPDAQKSVRGLIECLNEWGADVAAMLGMGCVLHTAAGTLRGISFTKRLKADIICPDEEAATRQRQIYEDMLAGKPVPAEMKYWAAKRRNPGSLRVRLEYAGRTVELAGDCFGAGWDMEGQRPCDILKVPHHGAGGALSGEQMDRLRPLYAVISCEMEYIPRKDRPSKELVEQLEQRGTKVWFTDAFSAPGQEPRYWPCAAFTIYEDGTILTPDSRGGGGR